jgi:hypothetical protein
MGVADKRKPTVSGFAKNAGSVTGPIDLSYTTHDGAVNFSMPPTARGFKEGDKVRAQDDGTLIFVDTKSLN